MNSQDGPVIARLVEEQIITPDKDSGRAHWYKLTGDALAELLGQVNVDERGELYLA